MFTFTQLILLLKRLFIVGFVAALFACGGGGGDGDKAEDLPPQPQNVSAAAGNNQVTLSWGKVNTATAYDICSASETITQPANCTVHKNGALAVDQTSPAVVAA